MSLGIPYSLEALFTFSFVGTKYMSSWADVAMGISMMAEIVDNNIFFILSPFYFISFVQTYENILNN